ncbi:MAG: nucleotide exchange factor GrpE, partial [Petrotogales bacterium]
MSAKKSTSKKKDIHDKKIDSLEKKQKKLEEEVEQLKQQLEEKEDKLLRSYAQLQNYQKRMEKELQNREYETKKKYLLEFLDLKELLNIAYKDKNPKNGLKLILNKLENFFEKENIKCIDCIGKAFDHNIHHAVCTIEKDDCEDESIAEEVKKGYMVDDKLLRP